MGQKAVNWRVERYLIPVIIGILGLSALMLLSFEAEGAMDITEEWIIDEGETEVVENETLNLYTNLRVYGSLEVYNSTINILEINIYIQVGSQGDLRIQKTIFNSIFDFYSYFPYIWLNGTARADLDDIQLFSRGFRISGPTDQLPTVTMNDFHTKAQNSYLIFFNINLTTNRMEISESSFKISDSRVHIRDSAISEADRSGLDIRFSHVELDNVSLFGNGHYGFEAVNSTVQQTNVNYLDSSGEDPNALGQFVYQRYMPIRVRFDGEVVNARCNITDARGSYFSITIDDVIGDDVPLTTERVTNVGPVELFPYTLRLTPEFDNYILDLPDATLTHVLDEFPNEVLNLTIPGELELDLHVTNLNLPERFYELEETDIYVTILNSGTATLYDIPVFLEAINSSSTSGQLYYGYADHSRIGPGEEATYHFTLYLHQGPHTLNISIGNPYLESMGVETVSVDHNIKVYSQIDKYKALEDESIHPGVYLLLVLLAVVGILGVYYQYRHILAVDEQKMRRFEDDPPQSETKTDKKPKAEAKAEDKPRAEEKDEAEDKAESKQDNEGPTEEESSTEEAD